MTFSLAGKQRPNKPNRAVLDAIQGAVTNALGPGYSVNVYSGQENPGHRHGSNRHGTGFAADVHIVGPDGKMLNARENKQEMLAVAKSFKELGGLGVGLGTDYMGGTGIHLDMVEAGVGQDNAWGNIGNEFQGWLENYYRSPMLAALPETMQAPLSLAETQMRDEAIATAFADPARALDIPAAPVSLPSRPTTPTPMMAMNTLSPPSRFPSVAVGQVTRAPLDAIPASLTPAPVGRVERAPLPDIGQFTTPARSLQHPVSAPKPAPLAAAPVGQVTRAALAPAAPNAQTMAEAYGQYAASRMEAEKQAQAAQTAKLAEQYGMYRPGTVPQPATPLAHPVSVPAVAPPAAVTPPAPVLAPALAPPKAIQDRPIADIAAPPAAPAPTAYDVYSGLATQAKDNTGQNTVGMLPDGTTTVTNKYGVTTGMTPYGKQTAVGNLPGLPGITGPVGRTAAKIGIPALGTAALGPIGGLLGSAIVGALSKPGGVLSGLRNVDTMFGNITAHAVNPGLNSFPDRPSGGIRSATFSNRSAEGMRSMSPKAASDISAGRGGLF